MTGYHNSENEYFETALKKKTTTKQQRTPPNPIA